MIEATYVLTIDDLVEAGKAAYGGDRAVARFRVQWIVIGIGLIVAVLTQKPSPVYWILVLGAVCIWIAISHPGRHFRNHFEKSVTNEQVLAQINEEDVRTSSPTDRSEIKWEGFRSLIETPRTISLITNSNTILVFPKRAFNEQSCNELRRLAAAKGISTKPR